MGYDFLWDLFDMVGVTAGSPPKIVADLSTKHHVRFLDGSAMLCGGESCTAHHFYAAIMMRVRTTSSR